MENFFTESYPDTGLPTEPGQSGVAWKQFTMELIQTILIALVLFLGINAVSSRIRVKSISMQPTLYEKDFVIVNKLAYRFGQPQRGDIIVFIYPPDPETEPYIKRIIGLSGETVRVERGQVYINNAPLDEPYIKMQPTYSGSWEVPEGALFVLGDNRNNSSDSHQWGMVPMENVIGQAVVIYYPFSHWKILNPSTAAAAGP